MEFDVVVVGAGAAGLAAARTARRGGARVAMIANGPVGGDCTFVGCIPSKTLIEASRGGLDFPATMARVRATVERVAATETPEVVRREGIDVVEGRARLAGGRDVEVDGRRIACRRLVLATGSRPALPPIPGLAGIGPLTNENVFDLTRLPASLLVIGGGPLGVELAQAFARLGTTVTIIEAERRLVPREEPEASACVEAALTADGVQVRTGRKVNSLTPEPPGAVARLDDGNLVAVHSVLVATGRVPGTGDLGLDAAGVTTDPRGFIVTDSRMRTSVAGIYAAGDVTGRAASTHAADEMGRVAATNALARVPYRRFHDNSIPSVTFTDPEVARVGLTEQDAATAAPGAQVAYLPLDEVDRAVTAGRTEGYIKLIAGPRRVSGNLAGGRLLGATVVASRAGEMIALPALAIRNGMLPARLALTVQAYPTWTLGIRQAAALFFVEAGGRRSRPVRSTTSSRSGAGQGHGAGQPDRAGDGAS